MSSASADLCWLYPFLARMPRVVNEMLPWQLSQYHKQFMIAIIQNVRNELHSHLKNICPIWFQFAHILQTELSIHVHVIDVKYRVFSLNLIITDLNNPLPDQHAFIIKIKKLTYYSLDSYYCGEI